MAIGGFDKALHISAEFEDIKTSHNQRLFEHGELNALKQYIRGLLFTATASDSLTVHVEDSSMKSEKCYAHC